ncbi:hypothetical protein GIB67_015398 [Kingdonia uniflora]|uniref:Protein kinase domain-containing protein n=1 Tax=Kingdonia uniflora TaxID=39325 RepID=A0A7J7KYU4_9MAGN|nr:hypothetical protein GIB67_015398 [Kingdonia uniflora]
MACNQSRPKMRRYSDLLSMSKKLINSIIGHVVTGRLIRPTGTSVEPLKPFSSTFAGVIQYVICIILTVWRKRTSVALPVSMNIVCSMICLILIMMTSGSECENLMCETSQSIKEIPSGLGRWLISSKRTGNFLGSLVVNRSDHGCIWLSRLVLSVGLSLSLSIVFSDALENFGIWKFNGISMAKSSMQIGLLSLLQGGERSVQVRCGLGPGICFALRSSRHSRADLRLGDMDVCRVESLKSSEVESYSSNSNLGSKQRSPPYASIFYKFDTMTGALVLWEGDVCNWWIRVTPNNNNVTQLVILDNSVLYWQSFNYPTDTPLPGANFTLDRVSGERNDLISWKSSEDPATGTIRLRLDTDGRSLVLNRSLTRLELDFEEQIVLFTWEVNSKSKHWRSVVAQSTLTELKGSRGKIISVVGGVIVGTVTLTGLVMVMCKWKGGFGSAFRGTLPNSSAIAVKKLECFTVGEKQLLEEVNTIGLIQHLNLVRLWGFCAESWKTRYNIALGVTRGLAYLRENCRDCIIHCDNKPENILLDTEFSPRIAYFSLAKLLGQDFSRVLTTMRGTRGYLAPEWISGLPITPKADVYSYG